MIIDSWRGLHTLPFCGVAFTLVPRMTSLSSLMTVLIIFTFVMSAWRSPVVALMPDITPGPLRSQANGIVNLMGGLGSLIAFFVGGILFKAGGFPLPFLMSAVMMLVALAVLALFVREPKQAYESDSSSAEKIKKTDIKLTKEEKKSLLLILFGVFFWFTGYNGISLFFVRHGEDIPESVSAAQVLEGLDD